MAELVLDRLQALVDDPEDPQTRLNRFARFADYFPRLEGKLTPELIRKGFKLLEEVDELQPDEESSSAQKSISANIESCLIAEWALHDFESALNEVRLQFLTAITQRVSGQRARFRLR